MPSTSHHISHRRSKCGTNQIEFSDAPPCVGVDEGANNRLRHSDIRVFGFDSEVEIRAPSFTLSFAFGWVCEAPAKPIGDSGRAHKSFAVDLHTHDLYRPATKGGIGTLDCAGYEL